MSTVPHKIYSFLPIPSILFVSNHFFLCSLHPSLDSSGSLNSLSLVPLLGLPTCCFYTKPSSTRFLLGPLSHWFQISAQMSPYQRTFRDQAVQNNTSSPPQRALFSSIALSTTWYITLLKYELKHIANFVYSSKNWFRLSSAKPEVVRSAPPTGAREKAYIEKMPKQRREIIDGL